MSESPRFDFLRHAAVSLAAATVLLAACGGGGGSDPPATPPLQPTQPTQPTQPVPQALQGQWMATLARQCPCGSAGLMIAATNYSIDGPEGSTLDGSAAPSGDDGVTFSGNSACPQSVNYKWTVSGNTLSFALATGAVDSCARRTQILTGQPWTRAG